MSEKKQGVCECAISNMSEINTVNDSTNEKGPSYKLSTDETSSEENEITILKKKIPEKLDSLNFSTFHLFIIISLGITWVLDGYEVSLLTVLSGVLKKTFSMDDSEIGLAGSLYLLGCATGSLFFGYLAGKWGRKLLFNVTLGIYCISIILTSISINKLMFFFCRFLTGVSVGGEYSSIFAAIDELIPPSIRGRADLIIDGTWHLGSTIAAILSYLVLTNFPDIQEISIRLLFILGVLLTLPVMYMRRGIPESPRWLIYRGRYKDALTTVNKIEKKCRSKKYYSNAEENETSDLIDWTKEFPNVKNENKEVIAFKEILHTLIFKHRVKFFYALVLMASQAFFYNGVFYSYTLVLQNFYKIPKETVGLYLIPLSCASFLGPIVLGKLFDSWSRRKMIALTYVGSGLLLVFTALNFLNEYFNFTMQQVFWFVTCLVASPAASSAHLTVSEIFPIEMRSQAMAIFFSFGLGIGGVVSPFLFGSFVKDDNKQTIFFSYVIAAVIMILAGIFGFFKGVDAENKPLEEISEENKQEDEVLKI